MRRSWTLWISLLAGCGRADEPRVAEETLTTARRENFAYRAALRQSLKGDIDALREMLRFASKTDAAGALGHGAVLAELLVKVGEDLAVHAAAKLDAEEKRSCLDVLKAGTCYSSDPRVKDVELEKLFPALVAALQGRR